MITGRLSPSSLRALRTGSHSLLYMGTSEAYTPAPPSSRPFWVVAKLSVLGLPTDRPTVHLGSDREHQGLVSTSDQERLLEGGQPDALGGGASLLC